MASKTKRTVVNSAELVQGIVLVTFAAASTIFTDKGGYGLSSLKYGSFLSRRTKGWAVGVRLATLYVGAHPRPVPPVPDQVTMPQVEPLTEREREVLHHYSGLLSVAEVASELCISVNTVKTHLKNCQHAPQEDLPQAGRRIAAAGGPPSPPARADLTAGKPTDTARQG